jgi:Uma2 family endonuclease
VDIAPLIDPLRLARLRRGIFERMIEEEMFDEKARIQLLDGVLVEMSPQGDDHARAIVRLTNLLARLLAGRADVAPQVPFNASEFSRPEPDVALWPAGGDGGPVPEKPLLVIEVAITSLRDDRCLMAPIYADAGVPEYWIINLPDDLVEVHTEPSAQGYGRVASLRRGESLSLVSFPDLRVAVADLLPPR